MRLVLFVRAPEPTCATLLGKAWAWREFLWRGVSQVFALYSLTSLKKWAWIAQDGFKSLSI